MRHRLNLYLWFAACLGMLLSLSELAIAADVKRLCQGVVRDQHGAPAASAIVCLVEAKRGKWPTVIDSTMTNERGEYALKVVLPVEARTTDGPAPSPDGPDWVRPPVDASNAYDKPLRTSFQRFQVWARNPHDRAIGVTGLLDENALRADVALQPMGGESLNVAQADLQPAQNAKVAFVGFSIQELMPREWISAYEVRTRDAVASTQLWPRSGGQLLVSGESYAPLLLTWNPKWLADPMSQRPQNTIHAASRKVQKGEVRYWHVEPLKEPVRWEFRTPYQRQEPHLPWMNGIALNEFIISAHQYELHSASGVSWDQYFQSDHISFTDLKLRSYQCHAFLENGQWSLLIYQTGQVKGRVVDQRTGLPVSRQTISFMETDPEIAEILSSTQVVTNATGEFEATVPITTQRCSLRDELIERTDFKPGRTLDLGTLEIESTTALRGFVVDANRRPVPNAQVYFSHRIGGKSRWNRNLLTVTADESGAFVIPMGTDQNRWNREWIHVKHGEQCSERVVIERATQVNAPPMVFVIKPSSTLKLSGRVIDERGRALKNRPVIVWREVPSEPNHQYEDMPVEPVDELRTDDQGLFTSHALSANLAYYVQVRDPLGGSQNSHRVFRPEGGTMDLNDFTVPTVTKTLRGQVVDLNGKAIQGVVIRRLQPKGAASDVVTDDTGRFELPNVTSVGTILSFDHRSYRPVARIVRELDQPLRVSLLQPDERPPITNPKRERGTSQTVSRETVDDLPPVRNEYYWERNLPRDIDDQSRDLIQRALKLVAQLPDPSDYEKRESARLLGRIDPEVALTNLMQEPLGQYVRDRSQSALPLFVEIGRNDRERFCSVLKHWPVEHELLSIQSQLLEYYAPRDPELTRFLASELIRLEPRIKSDPYFEGRYWSIVARSYELLHDEPNLKATLTKAADQWLPYLASTSAVQHTEQQMLRRLMQQHVPELADRIDAAHQKAQRAYQVQQTSLATSGFTASALKHWNWKLLTPETAEAWLDDVEARNFTRPDQSTIEDRDLIRKVGEKNPEVARRLVRFLIQHYGEGHYHWTNPLILRWDPRRVWDRIDEQILALRQPRTRSFDWQPETQFLAYSYLIVQGHEVGYPDMDTLVALAVANYKRVAKSRENDNETNPVDYAMQGLVNVAFFAPEEARPLVNALRPLIPIKELNHGKLSRNHRYRYGISRQSWHVLLALLDPSEALKQLQTEVEYLNRERPKRVEDFGWGGPDQYAGILTLAEFWSTPKNQRSRFMVHPAVYR